MKSNLFFTTFYLIILLNAIYAQDSTFILNEIIVTYHANKLTPMSFANIPQDAITAKLFGQEPSFLLSTTPSITVYSDAGSMQGYSYFRLRGIDQTRINISLDGVPLSEPEDQGAYFSNYPDIFNSLSKVQIQRGVGTSKNGTASYGGSVQLFSPNLHNGSVTNLGADYGSFNFYRVFGEVNSGIKNGKGIYVRAANLHSDGYKYHSGNSSRSIFMSGGIFRPKVSWKTNLFTGHQKNNLAWIGVSDSLIKINRRTNANSNGETDCFFQYFSQFQNSIVIGENSTLQSCIYYIFLDGNYNFDLNNFIGLPSNKEMFNYAVQSNWLGYFMNYTYSNKEFNWTVGGHTFMYNRKHVGSEKTLGELYSNTGYKNEVSMNTKLEYKLISLLQAYLDLQYRYTEFNYKGSVPFDKLHWNFFNPKVGILYTPTRNLTFYYSVGRTSREPTRNDMFKGNDNLEADENSLLTINNTQAERVTDHEAGVRLQHKNIAIDGNVYYMNFKNEIVLDGKFGPNGLALTKNVAKSYRMGVEVSIRYQCGNFLFSNNSSWNQSRIKQQNVKFSPILTPSLIINQGIEYSRNPFTVAIDGRYQSSSYIDFAEQVKIAPYFLAGISSSYVYKSFKLTFRLNNITNAKYYNNAYVDFDSNSKYFVQAPINFLISLKYTL